jgi:SAM-dependent methyltransferase
MKEEEIKRSVRKGYAKIARQDTSPCGGSESCCGSSGAETISKQIGYTEEDLKNAPEGANLGLGCGNPVALASLKEGEVVLDLGSGAGFDCFLAAKRVGKEGKVIGVDMTPEMIERARENARKDNYENVEFRLGEIENLPAADHSVDVVISNCVINLSPDKRRVFQEAFRVLRPGGRLMVSDIVLLKELPAAIKNSIEAYVGCLSGAISKEDYVNALKYAGFQQVEIVEETGFPIELMANDPTANAVARDLGIKAEELQTLADTAVSIKISATKLE